MGAGGGGLKDDILSVYDLLIVHKKGSILEPIGPYTDHFLEGTRVVSTGIGVLLG